MLTGSRPALENPCWPTLGKPAVGACGMSGEPNPSAPRPIGRGPIPIGVGVKPNPGFGSAGQIGEPATDPKYGSIIFDLLTRQFSLVYCSLLLSLTTSRD